MLIAWVGQKARNPRYRASVPTKPAVQSAQSMSGPSHKGTDHVFDHQQNVLRRRNCTQNMVWTSWLMQPSRWREKSQPRNNNQQKPNDRRNDKSGRVVIEVHWRADKLPRHLQPASSRTSRGAKAAPVINAQHRKQQKFSLVCRRRTMMVLIPNWNRVWVDELNYPREDSIDYSYNWWAVSGNGRTVTIRQSLGIYRFSLAFDSEYSSGDHSLWLYRVGKESADRVPS
eukprot:scaffold3089_cov122-Cylindrotheca_fusiformis.AAC.1